MAITMKTLGPSFYIHIIKEDIKRCEKIKISQRGCYGAIRKNMV
jgi:hypothetical protein